MTIRDALCFLLLGLMAPALYFAFTGRPWPLAAWLVVWIITTAVPRNP
jgi:hypothetical protein